MKKRVFSLLLALCLCLTLLPTAALADEGGSAPTTPTHSCATEGHVVSAEDATKCAHCDVAIVKSGDWLTWANEEHTNKSGEGTWSFAADGTLTIHGTGKIEEYYRSDATPWFECLASVKKLVIGEGITRVGASSFSNSPNLTEVILPDSLTEIGVYAFGECTALTALRIPKAVKTIENGAFSCCDKLEAFEVTEGNTHFFVMDGVLFRKNFVISTTADPETSEETDTPTGTWTLIAYPANKAGTSYAIPENVTAILGEAFRAADRLTGLSLPASLTAISDDVLSSCSNLTTIHVAEGNTAYKSIDGVLFSADGKTLLYYPPAKAGSSYTIPSSVTEIGASAFYCATALTSVTIPEGVITIGYLAFMGCTALREVTIPASVTSIGERVFDTCTSLTAIHVAEGSTAYKSIDGVLFSADGKTLIRCPIMKTGSYTVPDGVETIGAYAFSQSELTSVSLPEGVKTIEAYAFLNTHNLTSVSLPSTVTSIDAWAFLGCDVLRNVYFAGSESDWSSMTIPNKDGWFGAEDTTNTCLGIDVTVTTVHCDFDGMLTVTLNPNGGTLKDGTQTSWTVPYNTVSSYTPPVPSSTPGRAGYSFAGWAYSVDVYNRQTQTVSTTSRIWNWADPVYTDMELVAQWSKTVITYPVTLSTGAHGTVTASATRASSGSAVVLTVEPKTGYKLDSLLIVDENGKNVTVTQREDGRYCFVMPDCGVSVTTRFLAENWLNPFTDVTTADWYYDAVSWACQNGVATGTSATTFSPNDSCTRAQLVTLLWRAAGCPEPKTASSFADVFANAYYAKAVAWAVENGITGGIGNNQFAPDLTCTRAQAVAFLFRYAASQGMDAVTLQELVSGYGDAAQVPGYALSAFNWALATNLVQGAGGKLLPNDSCTRAQIVTMLYRYFG